MTNVRRPRCRHTTERLFVYHLSVGSTSVNWKRNSWWMPESTNLFADFPNAFHPNYCVFKQSVLLLVLFSSFKFMIARFYMSVPKSGRNSCRHHGLCEASWAAGIHSGKGVEFYSVCHFVHVSSCTNPMWVNDLLVQSKYLRTWVYNFWNFQVRRHFSSLRQYGHKFESKSILYLLWSLLWHRVVC